MKKVTELDGEQTGYGPGGMDGGSKYDLNTWHKILKDLMHWEMLLSYLCEYLSACMYVFHVCAWCPPRTKEGTGSLELD